MIRHKAYKYDAAKTHVEKMLKHAKAKPMPGKKGIKLYRVWKEPTEVRTQTDTVTQSGSAKLTATGDAATEFVARAVEHHQRRADIHEWHKDKGLTDDEVEPLDDIGDAIKKEEELLKNPKQKKQ